MINLLPKKEKEALSFEAVRNLVLIFGAISVISITCLILALLAIKFFILSQKAPQNFLLEEARKKYQSQEIASVKNIIQNYNRKVPAILSFYENNSSLGGALYEISGTEKPAGLNFTGIFLNGQAFKDRVLVNITGSSLSRDDLLAFQKGLALHKKIKNTYFSPESWINPGKSIFNLTFEFYENAD